MFYWPDFIQNQNTRLNNVSILLVALANTGYLDISLFHQAFLEAVLKFPAERIAEFLYLVSKLEDSRGVFSVMHSTRLLLLSCEDYSVLRNIFQHLFSLDPTDVKQHYHGYVNSIIWLGSERSESTISSASAALFESIYCGIRRNIVTLESVESFEAYESFINWIKFQLECSSDCSWYKHIFREELLKIFSHVKLSKDEQNICCLFDAFTNIAPPDSPYPDLSKTERLLQLLISISSTTSDGDKESLDLIGSLIFQSIWSCKTSRFCFLRSDVT
ncbi:hypothetical protein BKA69DRAFT_9415 [Paraphysoderma sedebokerense]|nr:hypothetical protein BKA69DRAFT_9415 [Paraphysoderma sedebokerense]